MGLLLALSLPAGLRYLVMPVGFVTSFFIEGCQGPALPARTPSLYDIVANTAGACLGLIIVAFVETRVRGES